MADCRPAKVPMQPGTELVRYSMETEEIPYREIIGSLLFVAQSTRPDIAFAVSKLTQFLNGFNESHWKAATKDFGITFKATGLDQSITSKEYNNEISLTGYCDSDYAGDKISRRSTTGHIFFINESPISWISQKPPVVACSSTEAEYIALASAAREAVWIRRLLS